MVLNTGDIRHLSNNEANRITRESICTALLKLLRTKELKDISVSELVRCAGVSRQSFYRNYSSKEDVVSEIKEEITMRLSEKMNDPAYKDNPKQWFLELFSLLRANTAVVAMLKRADQFETSLSGIPVMNESRFNERRSGFHYGIIGTLAAINAIALDWFNNGMKESDEEMADICMNFVWRS